MRAARLEPRLGLAPVLVTGLAPFLQQVPEVIYMLGRPEEVFMIPVVWLLSALYDLAEAVFVLPVSLPCGLVALVVVYGLARTVGLGNPWPCRLAVIAMGCGFCLGRLLNFGTVDAYALGRTWHIASGTVPASFFTAWVLCNPDKGAGEAA